MFLKEWLFHISTFLSSPNLSGATSDVEQNPHGAIICPWLAAKCSETPSFASRAPPPPPFYAPPWDHNKVTLNTAQSLQELEGGGGVGEGGGNQSIPSNTNSEWKTHKQEQDLPWTHPYYYE